MTINSEEQPSNPTYRGNHVLWCASARRFLPLARQGDTEYPEPKQNKLSKKAAKGKARSSRALGRSQVIGFMPDKFRTTLRYSSTHNLTSTSGAVGRYEFIGNGLYDPDYTSAGHQPYGFDQLMLMYSKAVVHSCKIRVTGTAQQTYAPMVLLVQHGPLNLAIPSSIGDAVERSPKESWGICTSTNPLTITSTGTTEELLGVPLSMQLAEQDLWSTTGANPALFWYVRLYYQTMDGGTTSTANVLAELEFDVTFFKPVQVSPS